MGTPVVPLSIRTCARVYPGEQGVLLYALPWWLAYLYMGYTIHVPRAPIYIEGGAPPVHVPSTPLQYQSWCCTVGVGVAPCGRRSRPGHPHPHSTVPGPVLQWGTWYMYRGGVPPLYIYMGGTHVTVPPCTGVPCPMGVHTAEQGNPPGYTRAHTCMGYPYMGYPYWYIVIHCTMQITTYRSTGMSRHGTLYRSGIS